MTPAHLSGKWPQAVVDAARFERERREASYPKAVRERRMKADDAQADFAAWVAIHDWLAGKPRRDVCTWAELETAAAKALTSIDGKMERIAQEDLAKATDANPDYADLQLRRARLFTIHRAVSNMARWVAETNRQLRDRAAAPAGLAA